MSKKTYYEILGVSKTATQAEIKIAYRKQARQWHPDFHAMELDGKKHVAEEMIKIINEAYNVLSDSFQRSSYDLDLSRGLGFVSIPDFFSQEKKQENSYHSSNDNNKKPGFGNELKDALKSAIVSLKNKEPISLYQSAMLYMLFEIHESLGSFTPEEMELINELRSLLYPSGINNIANDFNNYNGNGDSKKFGKKY